MTWCVAPLFALLTLLTNINQAIHAHHYGGMERWQKVQSGFRTADVGGQRRLVG
jgi:hypothetical protein